MVFLARLILKGPSQAALVAATLAIVGIVFMPATWLSAAAIALVALVKDQRQTLLVLAITALGSMLFASLIFASPSMTVYFMLMAWLPAWIAASVLRAVSLAASLHLIAGLSLIAIIVIYTFFPEMGEIWREPLDLLVQELANQSQGQLSLEVLQEIKELTIKMIPGFLASSVLLGTMISLFLARWWQAVILNPGGFAKEFQALNLGKAAAVIAIAIVVAAQLMSSELWYAMLLIVLVLYLTQATAILHSVFNGKQLKKFWLYPIYLAMIFVPEAAAVLILIGIADAWIDFRGRLVTA